MTSTETPKLRPDRARRHRLIVFTIIVVALGAIGWRKVLRDEFVPKNFGVVEPNAIYRSGQLSERMLRKVIEENRIKTIVALNDHDEASTMERAVAQELGIDRIGYELIGDGTGDPALYAKVVELMADPTRHPMLVHCAAGAQRTSTSVILYRHLVQGKPITEAYPESFGFKHDSDDWVLLAYVADHVDDVKAALTPPAPPADDDGSPP